MANGTIEPTEVIEGSSVTARCSAGFRLDGDWILHCTKSASGLALDRELPKCVQLQPGSSILLRQSPSDKIQNLPIRL